VIRALIDAGADVNEALPLGRTPLMAAARTGNVDALSALSTAAAASTPRETLRGTTALMWAADEGHADARAVLIRPRGATSRRAPAPGRARPRAGSRQVQRSAQAGGGAGPPP
jgi:ankyrin repeat protein